jgi:hypothetical protein
MPRQLMLAIAALLIAANAGAQTKYPPETRNAALRYWFAFADLQDSASDQDTQSLLERIAAGEAAWDEAKLGTVLDKNETAIVHMQRATTLPECDWGLAYSDAWQASIAYAPKARVLARLNTVYGARLAARGETQMAVDSWLAGVRFSQHVAKGGPLIFALIAKATLLPNLKALTHAAQDGSLSTAQRKQIETAIRALPESAFDWSEAVRLEEAGLDVAMDQIAAAKDPLRYYQDMLGTAAPQGFKLPTAEERLAFHKLMLSAEKALGQPPDQVNEKLKMLQQQIGKMPQFFQQLTPSFTKENEARAQIATARGQLLQALASK